MPTPPPPTQGFWSPLTSPPCPRKTLAAPPPEDPCQREPEGKEPILGVQVPDRETEAVDSVPARAFCPEPNALGSSCWWGYGREWTQVKKKGRQRKALPQSATCIPVPALSKRPEVCLEERRLGGTSRSQGGPRETEVRDHRLPPHPSLPSATRAGAGFNFPRLGRQAPSASTRARSPEPGDVGLQ